MRVSFYKADLLDALKLVSRSVATKSMTPVLSGIYLNAASTRLELQSFDNTTNTIARIPANVEVEGRTVVGGKQFAAIMARQPDDTVTLETVDNQLAITSGASKFELMTYAAEDFPTAKRIEGQRISIKASLLKELIAKTAYAVADKNESREIFKGIYLEIGGGQIKATATNTHRIAHFKVPFDVEGNVSAIVPAETLKNLRVVLPDDETEVRLTFGARQVAIQFGDYYLSTRLMEGTYPPYEKVIPADSEFTAEVNRREFKSTLDRIGLIASGNEYNTVVLTFAENELEVSAHDEKSSGREPLEIVGGSDLAIAFNQSYLMDYLNSTTAETLQFKLKGKYEPILCQETGNDNYLYVVTPVRT